ncbi:hypothetical protein ACFL0H_08180 [Thermodesulfobacteriota bacterium]
MSEDYKKSERLWELGWDGHEKAQLLRMSRLSLREKIKWLEEAQEVFENLSKRKNNVKNKTIIANHK